MPEGWPALVEQEQRLIIGSYVAVVFFFCLFVLLGAISLTFLFGPAPDFLAVFFHSRFNKACVMATDYY